MLLVCVRVAGQGLLASWDETTSIIVMHHTTASKVEGTALTLIDSLSMLTESVEKLDRYAIDLFVVCKCRCGSGSGVVAVVSVTASVASRCRCEG